MLKYILKRLLIFIPTLLVISLLTFIISANTPGDPVEQMIGSTRTDGSFSSKIAGEKAYIEKRRELGLDLPVFYFSFSDAAEPDTLYRIPKKLHRDYLAVLIRNFGNWAEISEYYKSLVDMENEAFAMKVPFENADQEILLKELISNLWYIEEAEDTREQLEEIIDASSTIPEFSSTRIAALTAQKKFEEVISNEKSHLNYIPAINFYGINNQYHRWFFGAGQSGGFIRGDFGTSYKSKRPVSEEIGEAISITLKLSLAAILITYLISIPLGVFSAVNKGSAKDQVITTFLFVLYSLPAFWVGTMLIIFLGGGDWFDWFPPYGLGDVYPETTFWEALKIRTHHLILPMICLIYPSFAFLSRQARGGILNVLHQDYIQTARAKGLPEHKVIWKHSFRNALLPIITLFANVFPATIVGAVVVEIVFSIPGMGKLTLEALYARNYPVVYTVVMISAMMTMIGFLIADILYAIADPRISFNKNKSA